MSEFEFKVPEKKVKITIGGKSYPLRFPTNGERNKWEREVKEAKTDEQSEKLSNELLIKLGVPSEVVAQLDVGDYLDFIKWLMSGGKKN